MNLVTLNYECANLPGSRHRQSKPHPSTLHPPSPRRSDHHHFVRVMCMRADHEVSQDTSETEISTQGRSIGGNTHQPKEKLITIRRGERGWAGRCGPSRSPASCSPSTHLGGRRSPPHPRATIKAINAAPNPTSTTLAPADRPASCLTSRLRSKQLPAERDRSFAALRMTCRTPLKAAHERSYLQMSTFHLHCFSFGDRISLVEYFENLQPLQ